MGNLEKGKWSENGVIVTVYEEESHSHTHTHTHTHRNINEKITRERKSKLECNYYNRRADLLAYAHNLRQHLNLITPSSPTKPKRKRRLWGSLRIFGGKKRALRRYLKRVKWTQVSKILRRLLKEISSTCKCK